MSLHFPLHNLQWDIFLINNNKQKNNPRLTTRVIPQL